VIYIRFGSHRAREYGLRALGRRPQAYFSLTRETGPGGVYAVSEEEYTAIRAAIAGARWQHSVTRLRGPYDDLMECWSD
jgi:hypothetical protein